MNRNALIVFNCSIMQYEAGALADPPLMTFVYKDISLLFEDTHNATAMLQAEKESAAWSISDLKSSGARTSGSRESP